MVGDLGDKVTEGVAICIAAEIGVFGLVDLASDFWLGFSLRRGCIRPVSQVLVSGVQRA